MNIIIQIKDGIVQEVTADFPLGSVTVEDYDTLTGEQLDQDGVEVYQYDDVAITVNAKAVASTIQHYSSTANDIWED